MSKKVVSGEVQTRINNARDFGFQFGMASGSLSALARRIGEFVPKFGEDDEDKAAWGEVAVGLAMSRDSRDGMAIYRRLDSGMYVRIAPSEADNFPMTRTVSSVYAISLTVSELSAIDKAEPEWGRVVGNVRQDTLTYIRGAKQNIKKGIAKHREEQARVEQMIAAGERGEQYIAPKRDTSAKAIASYLAGIVESLPGKNKRAIAQNDATALDPADCDKLVSYIKRLIK